VKDECDPLVIVELIEHCQKARRIDPFWLCRRGSPIGWAIRRDFVADPRAAPVVRRDSQADAVQPTS
jgi:hypothetical protein